MGRPVLNMDGQTHGFLTVLGRAGLVHEQAAWRCRCVCGKEVVVVGAYLRTKGHPSCGCKHGEGQVRHGCARRKKNGGKTDVYNIWRLMLARCQSPKTAHYEDYGGRGIGVCDRWRTDFLAFQADIGPRPSVEHSIDRIDNNGNYEPGNVRWATPVEQANNRRARRPGWLLEVIRAFAADQRAALGAA